MKDRENFNPAILAEWTPPGKKVVRCKTESHTLLRKISAFKCEKILVLVILAEYSDITVWAARNLPALLNPYRIDIFPSLQPEICVPWHLKG